MACHLPLRALQSKTKERETNFSETYRTRTMIDDGRSHSLDLFYLVLSFSFCSPSHSELVSLSLVLLGHVSFSSRLSFQYRWDELCCMLIFCFFGLAFGLAFGHVSCILINTLIKQPWRDVYAVHTTYPLRFTYLIGSGYSSLSVWTGVFGSKAGSFVESITTVNQSDETLPGRVCQFQLWNPLPWWALRCMLFPFVHQGPGPATVLHFLMFRVLRGLIVFSFITKSTSYLFQNELHTIKNINVWLQGCVRIGVKIDWQWFEEYFDISWCCEQP